MRSVCTYIDIAIADQPGSQRHEQDHKLPSSRETNIGEAATKEDNKQVK